MTPYKSRKKTYLDLKKMSTKAPYTKNNEHGKFHGKKLGEWVGKMAILFYKIRNEKLSADIFDLARAISLQ